MLLTQTERFRLLLEAQGVQISRWHNIKLFLIGSFFNYVIPGGVGGDAIKAFYLHKDLGHQSKSVPYTVLFDRFLGLYVMLAMALIVMIFDWPRFAASRELQSIAVFFMMAFFGLTAVTAIMLAHKGRQLILRFVPMRMARLRAIITTINTAFEFYARAPRIVLLSIFWSFTCQVAAVLSLYAVGLSMVAAGRLAPGLDLPLRSFFFVAPLGFVLSAIPIAPAGIGLGQAAFFFLFNAYLGQKTAVGPTSITVMQIVIFCWSLFGLLFYVARRTHPKDESISKTQPSD